MEELELIYSSSVEVEYNIHQIKNNLYRITVYHNQNVFKEIEIIANSHDLAIEEAKQYFDVV